MNTKTNIDACNSSREEKTHPAPPSGPGKPNKPPVAVRLLAWGPFFARLAGALAFILLTSCSTCGGCHSGGGGSGGASSAGGTAGGTGGSCCSSKPSETGFKK